VTEHARTCVSGRKQVGPLWDEGGDCGTAGAVQPTVWVRVAGAPRHTKGRRNFLQFVLPCVADEWTECAACSPGGDVATRAAAARCGTRSDGGVGGGSAGDRPLVGAVGAASWAPLGGLPHGLRCVRRLEGSSAWGWRAPRPRLRGAGAGGGTAAVDARGTQRRGTVTVGRSARRPSRRRDLQLSTEIQRFDSSL